MWCTDEWILSQHKCIIYSHDMIYHSKLGCIKPFMMWTCKPVWASQVICAQWSIERQAIFLKLWCYWLCCSSFGTVSGPLSLQWRHNGQHSVSNHRHLDGSSNRLFWANIKENIKARVTGPLWGESTGDLSISLTRHREHGKISIAWRHPVCKFSCDFWKGSFSSDACLDECILYSIAFHLYYRCM